MAAKVNVVRLILHKTIPVPILNAWLCLVYLFVLKVLLGAWNCVQGQGLDLTIFESRSTSQLATKCSCFGNNYSLATSHGYRLMILTQPSVALKIVFTGIRLFLIIQQTLSFKSNFLKQAWFLHWVYMQIISSWFRHLISLNLKTCLRARGT